MIIIKRGTLILDFDGVIVDSIAGIVECYNEDYRYYKKYIPVEACQIATYEFKELECASKNYLKHIWNRPRFFEKLKFMDNAEEVLNILKDDYHIQVVSLGLHPNLQLKRKWLEEHMPYVERFVGINIKDYDDKSHIDMSGCTFIDDLSLNLKTCNAKERILFGDNYAWNIGWNGKRCYNWYELLAELELDD